MVSFGVEDFVKRYGALKPSQFVDVVALSGDKADNIPGVEGIGDVNAVKLITKFGMFLTFFTKKLHLKTNIKSRLISLGFL